MRTLGDGLVVVRAQPDPSMPTGRHDYRERLVFIQRVLVPSVDFNAPGSRGQRLSPARVPAEGIPQPTVMFMRPGAVERWRVLNGSVDGRGFKRVMVLDGQFVFKGDRLVQEETSITETEVLGGGSAAVTGSKWNGYAIS